jgi:tetrahydromethanopterin S-methyltransferase subunit H
MIGSIFYEGSPLVEDERKGKFDKKRAKKVLREEEEISHSTGNPRITDIVGSTSKAIVRYIDFIAEETNSPFSIDGVTADVRIDATRHVEEVGLADRAIYNSISINCEAREVDAIKDAGIDSAILLCYNPRSPTIEGRVESLDKTLKLAAEAGIRKPLVDPCILDLPDPGPVSKTVYRIKEDYGLPTGCGAHNAIDQWSKRKKMDSHAYALSAAIANVFPIILGADFALYGPVEKARDIYAACSLADAYIAYSMKAEGIVPESKDHPLYRIFRPQPPHNLVRDGQLKV